jgi:hypothetical protein
MSYDVLLSPTFTGTAPCSPRISESAAVLPAVDDPAAAALKPYPEEGAAVGDFQSSPAPTSGSLPAGESEPPVTALSGAGDAYQPPVGYVLLEESLFELMMRRIADYASRADDLAVHSFLANPDFSRAMEAAE